MRDTESVGTVAFFRLRAHTESFSSDIPACAGIHVKRKTKAVRGGVAIHPHLV